MPVLSGAELKVLLYIVRRTFGFKKDSDSISLAQLVEGIRTADGRQLDGGTGLSKAAVASAVRSLCDHGVIVAERRSSRERGNEPTTYQLRFLTPLSRNKTRGGPEIRQGLVQKLDTQQTGEQQNRKEHHQGGGVVDELIQFGLTAKVAGRLAGEHDEATLRAKLDAVRWLRETRSPAVSRNPAGYLRKAIEDDFPPPPRYKTPAQRAEESARRAELLALVEQHDQAERSASAEPSPTRLISAPTYPPQEIPGTSTTTQTAWQKALQRLQNALGRATYLAVVSNTILARCDRSHAIVAAPSAYGARALRQRCHSQIHDALTDVLGFSVAIDYVTIAELSTDQPAARPRSPARTRSIAHTP